MLIVTGNISVSPSEVEAFAAEVAELGRFARGRDGCLSYAVAVENTTAGRLLVAERWRDQAALSEHLRADHTVAFVERWRGRMAGDVLKFDAVNGRSLDAD